MQTTPQKFHKVELFRTPLGACKFTVQGTQLRRYPTVVVCIFLVVVIILKITFSYLSLSPGQNAYSKAKAKSKAFFITNYRTHRIGFFHKHKQNETSYKVLLPLLSHNVIKLIKVIIALRYSQNNVIEIHL